MSESNPAPGGSAFAGLVALAEPGATATPLSKATLLDLSHVLEDLVEAHSTQGVVITGFQFARNWLSEVDRYERLARTGDRTVAVFTRDAIPDPVSVIPYRIASGSGLAEEWFVLVRTAEFSCALFGQDLDGLPADASELDRRFDTGWTFDPGIVDRMARHVLDQAEANGEPTANVREELDAVPRAEMQGPLMHAFYRAILLRLEEDKQRLRDSRERERRVHDALESSNNRMMRLERLSTLGTTAASFAHEVNNPLQVILAQAETVRWELEDASRGPGSSPVPAGLAKVIEEASNDVTEAAERIGRLTRAVLDIARDDQADLQSVDLFAWLRTHMARLERSMGARILIDTPVGVCGARIDSDRLLHVLTNLIQNAQRACSDPEAPIEIGMRCEAGHLRVRVIDHGSGIAPELQERLFQPFVSSHLGSGGTGLGLTLARRFVEDMHGTLALVNTGPEGSTFEIALPRATEEENKVVPKAREPLVLVVDDDEIVQRTLTRMLERHGYRTQSALSAEAARECLGRTKPDLCVVDFNLQTDLNGHQLVRHWIEQGLVAPGRSLLITGNLESTLPAGTGMPVLLKPFQQQALLDALKELEAAASDAG